MSDPTDLPQAESTTSEADADHQGDVAPDDRSVAGISDEQLPEELQPGEDNPLAQPLDPDDPNTRSQEELGVLDEGDGTDQDGQQAPDGESADAGAGAQIAGGEMGEQGDEGQAGISQG